MVFSSHVFLYYFLPLALLLYYASPGAAKNLVLTLVSYVFYAWTSPWFLALIAWSTLVDYACGNLIYGHWRLFGPKVQDSLGRPRASPRQRAVFLGVSLVSNVGMLFFFKYFMFLEANVNVLRQAFGWPGYPILAVILPAGISFYTFESISYNVDIFLGRARPAVVWLQEQAQQPPRHPLLLELRALNAFACYITQFPHLVAGPIIRYQELEAQVHARRHSLAKFGRGVFFFALGLGKKILIANPAGEIADAAFATARLHCPDAWYGLFAYAFQIYFDFSGYSDMAIGLGLMLGFEFFKNFDAPYQAQSVTEFWRRWHISLSTWLRIYLYVPLGGNRLGRIRTYVNLMTVMLLGGLWHGASWNFVIWGGIHGAWLSLERAFGKKSFYVGLPAAARVALTFLIVNLAWVFFRARNLSAAGLYLGSLFGLRQPTPQSLVARAILYSPDHALIMLLAAAIAFFGVTTWNLSKRLTLPRGLAALGLLAWAMAAMTAQDYSPFLYFRF
jgi:alginate O-acetyltransferase complex protein AlgI